MTELTVDLEFNCHACHKPIGVRLKCEGEGLNTAGVMPTIHIPCQSCGCVNGAVVSTDGSLLAVVPHAAPRRFEFIWN